jgi:hypothetical protein
MRVAIVDDDEPISYYSSDNEEFNELERKTILNMGRRKRQIEYEEEEASSESCTSSSSCSDLYDEFAAIVAVNPQKALQHSYLSNKLLDLDGIMKGMGMEDKKAQEFAWELISDSISGKAPQIKKMDTASRRICGLCGGSHICTFQIKRKYVGRNCAALARALVEYFDGVRHGESEGKWRAVLDANEKKRTHFA